jgi:hypothetical protein
MTNHRRGFTLVEAVIVAAVVTVLMVILIPIMREREQARLQALADTEPWEVFELRAATAKNAFILEENVVVLLDFVNSTNFSLTPPKDLGRSILVFKGATDYFFDIQLDESTDLTSIIGASPIGPGESVKYEVRFYPIAVGRAEVSVAYWSGKDKAVTGSDRAIAIVNLERYLVNRKKNGVLPRDEKRIQSNTFQLVIKESNYKWPTFDETFAYFESLE